MEVVELLGYHSEPFFKRRANQFWNDSSLVLGVINSNISLVLFVF